MLRCEDISMSFDGVVALHNVTTSFDPSRLTALVGPNGAGKTTLFNVLTGFLRPDRGNCFLGEEKITGIAPYRIAQKGVVRTFQSVRLVPDLSVLDNVLLAFPSQPGESLFRSAFRIGVFRSDTKNREVALSLLREFGVECKSHTPAGILSYGQQKLVSLAVCWATGARVLLLDEPLSGVSPNLVDQILGILRMARDKGKLVIFVEHDLSAVRSVADEVIVMDRGSILHRGQPTAVLARADVMDAYTS